MLPRITISNISGVIDAFNDAIVSFNQESLLEDLELMNALIERTRQTNGLSNWPNLRARLLITPLISGAEFLDYRTKFSINDQQFDDLILTQPEYLINTMDIFFAKSLETTGGMSYCSLVTGNMFKVIQSLKDGTAMERLQKLAGGQFFDQLVAQASNAIRNMFENLRQKVQGVMLRIQNLKNTIKTRIDSYQTKLDQELIRINHMLSPENMEAMVTRVKSQIDQFIDNVKNLNEDTIDYLSYMICKSTGPIENQMSSPIDALSGRVDAMEQTYGRLNSISRATTAGAVSSGAYRVDPSVRNNAVAGYNPPSSAGGSSAPSGPVYNDSAVSKPIRPITSDEIANITKWTPPGNGDSRIRFGPGLSEGKMGRQGWEKVDTRLRVIAMRLQQKMGLQLQINSGYRSPAYNGGLKGAAKKSLHMSGLALDITWNTIGSTREQFIRYAKEEGIGGIGRYGYRFVHIDLGASRSWSG